jgi:histidinol dehydrogenase
MKIIDYPRQKSVLEKAFARAEGRDRRVEAMVASVIEDVRTRGDASVLEYTLQFDGVRLSPNDLRVDPAVCERAWKKLSPNVARALEYAARGIERFHRRQMRKGFVLTAGGRRLEQRVRPLRRVGVYVPGGKATYPSTLLMNAIPAQVAGVPQIVVATPPVRGNPEDFVPFAAAHMLGIAGHVYQVGGAQAVAALAFGTKSIPKVDKVVGPGNLFVAEAKRMLYGVIDIDSVAGESEVLIIADTSASPDYIAADLLAQAEHTGGETVVLVGIGSKFNFTAVEAELKRQLRKAPRRAQAEKSLQTGCFFVRVENADQAVEVANLKAPEHLEILVSTRAEAIADRIDNVGAIFVGPWTPEPIGDYVAGPNHVLPTGGTARFFSPLGVDAFLKSSNVLSYSEKALKEAAPHAIALAESEGLFAHAEAVRIRLGK